MKTAVKAKPVLVTIGALPLARAALRAHIRPGISKTIPNTIVAPPMAMMASQFIYDFDA
jgi:hypothetical protein